MSCGGAGPVQFDYGTFISRFPEFADANLTLAQFQALFDEAGLYFRNDGTSPVSDPVKLLMIMNLITAHLASLYTITDDGHARSDLVGRIDSATQGSVSVSASYDVPGTASWWVATKYGAQAYQAIAAYRIGPRYRVPAAAYPGRFWW
jgi:hypothetical protein